MTETCPEDPRAWSGGPIKPENRTVGTKQGWRKGVQEHQNIANKEGGSLGREELQGKAEDEVRRDIIKAKKAKGHRGRMRQ